MLNIDPYRILVGLWKRRGVPLALNRFLQVYQPGHFYSPIPDPESVDNTALFDRSVTNIPGIDLCAGAQLSLVDSFSQFMDEMPFTDAPTNGLRYGFVNDYFSYGDALLLHGVMRTFKPQRIIEVGSGYSSAAMLDIADRFGEVSFTFIEPYPEHRLLKLLTQSDHARCEIRREPVQRTPLSVFDALEANDILFIDSSHVLKLGSDVHHLLSYVLPRLKPGVLVHVHDVFWPFEYPQAWLKEGRAWNEDYAVRAFLQFNSAFTIRIVADYLAEHHAERLFAALPLMQRNPGSSLWLQRI